MGPTTSSSSAGEGERDEAAERRQYLRFGAMIVTSTVVMFGLTYTNSRVFDHVRWSEERVYMALLMGGAMAVIMLGFMWGMLGNNLLNVAIVLGGIGLMGVALWLSRSQHLVDEREYMKGMIPHHSIAVLTSESSDIDDLRVCELANGIVPAQHQRQRSRGLPARDQTPFTTWCCLLASAVAVSGSGVRRVRSWCVAPRPMTGQQRCR